MPVTSRHYRFAPEVPDMHWANCNKENEGARASGFAAQAVTLKVRRLGKAISFYKHVFGFRVVADARHEAEPCVIMSAAGQACLTLREENRLNGIPSTDIARRRALRLRIAIRDLDQARASLWDLGVPLARGTGEPGEAGQPERSLFVDDPDGHRIELVEVRGAWQTGPAETGTS
jgi:catechol 2,3-dioxygenase-like lactoylglutathione lyase family enzyme